MAFNPPVNFSRGNGTPPSRGRTQDPLQLVALDKKLDGIFNMLTHQNQQMTALLTRGADSPANREFRWQAVCPGGKS